MTDAEKFRPAEERAKEFGKWCQNNRSKSRGPTCKVNIHNCFICQFAWLTLEAEEEKPLQCPFCGHDVIVHHVAQKEWVSCNCGYSSKMMDDGCSVAAHNRVARAVMAANESEAK